MAVKPRVFVSSVVEGFREYRQAAREGIVAAGGEPVLVNEDFPALAASSRNVCLDAVDSCDVYVVIVGERGGWTTPSGKLVVEEEYERARERRLPVLVFVQRGTRDADAARLLGRLSDYVTAMFRREFSTPDELREEVERAVAPLVKQLEAPAMNTALITERLSERQYNRSLKLRFALVPERDEEVIDLVRLGDRELTDLVHEIGHGRDVRLFSYEAPKERELRRDALVVRQEANRRREGEIPGMVLELSAGGLIYLETDVTGPGSAAAPLGFGGMMIVRSDVEALLRSAFAFANAWYAKHDPFLRRQRFYYGVALAGIEYRKWVDSAPQGNSFQMGTGSTPDPYLILGRPRLIGREDLANPTAEIERIATLAARELG
jgi:Domain of unknown function (DUF4062)